MQMGSKRKLEQKSPYHKIYLKEDYKRYSRTLHMIKGSVQEEDITIANIYAPNRGAPQCYDTRNLLQEKNCKKHKHMEIKQHISK